MSYFDPKLDGPLSPWLIYTICLNYETSLEKPIQKDIPHAYYMLFSVLILIFYIYLMPQQLKLYILINKQDKYVSYSKVPNLAAFRNILISRTFAFILNLKKVNVYKPSPCLQEYLSH